MALIDYDWNSYAFFRLKRRRNTTPVRSIVVHTKIVNAKTQDRVMVDADVFLHTTTKRCLNRVLKYDANRWLWRLWR